MGNNKEATIAALDRVGQATGQKIAKTETLLDSSQDQHAAVRRQPPTVKTGAQLLVFNG
tara:strand:- start:683 stop:859 length:177 start_codon:yes stop_codon:yes gene_type:complete